MMPCYNKKNKIFGYLFVYCVPQKFFQTWRRKKAKAISALSQRFKEALPKHAALL